MELDFETFKSIISNTDEEEVYTDYEACKLCAMRDRDNTCCAVCSCEIHPEDLKEVTEENIRKLLATNLVVIDKWEDSIDDDNPLHRFPETWFLRMKNIKEEHEVSLQFGSTCVALTENGCALEFQHRPYYGRRSACEKTKCKEDDNEINTKLRSAKAWSKHQDILKKLVEEYPWDTPSLSELYDDYFDFIISQIARENI